MIVFNKTLTHPLVQDWLLGILRNSLIKSNKNDKENNGFRISPSSASFSIHASVTRFEFSRLNAFSGSVVRVPAHSRTLCWRDQCYNDKSWSNPSSNSTIDYTDLQAQSNCGPSFILSFTILVKISLMMFVVIWSFVSKNKKFFFKFCPKRNPL